MPEECIHGLQYGCTDCRPRPRQAPTSRVFRARFDGTCECGSAIAADFDLIVMTDEGAMHAECAKALDQTRGIQ
jgi:hypothetical protein